MTLAQLQYFQALAHILHYTRTAEELHIAQPSLSYSINELEKELGVKLFNKEDRKITLTMYGEQFLPYVESALATINDGTEALRQMSGSAMQIIRLGYFHSISASLIPALMKDLYEQTENERLRFQFSEGSSFDLLGLLKKGDLDLTFCMHTDDWIETIPIMKQPLYLAVPQEHPLAERSFVNFADFANEPIILLDKTSSPAHPRGPDLRQGGHHAERSVRRARVQRRPAVRFARLRRIHSAAGAGHGQRAGLCSPDRRHRPRVRPHRVSGMGKEPSALPRRAPCARLYCGSLCAPHLDRRDR